MDGIETLKTCILCGSDRIVVIDREFNAGRCSACGLTFENPRPTLDAIVKFYSRPAQYDVWLQHLASRRRLWSRRLKKMDRYRMPGSLLDVGAGIGQFLHEARPHFREVAGTEVSDSAVKIARERYGLELMRGVVEELDFQSRTFNNITLFHVLEHVMSPGRMIAKCHELLSPGGRLFIAVPNDIASLGAMKRRLMRGGTPGTAATRGVHGLPRLVLDGSMDEIHLSHFTPTVLTRFLRGHGFEILDNSLDPYFVSSGAGLLGMTVLYRLFSAVKALTGYNGYGTIWVAARKI